MGEEQKKQLEEQLWNIGFIQIGVGKRTSRPTEARYV
jgi:hypothetical protein